MSILIANPASYTAAGSGGGSGSTLKLVTENTDSNAVFPTAMGTNSVAIGSGAQTLSSYSLAIGEQSVTRLKGQIATANGRFGSSGDAQLSTYIVRNITTGNIPMELFLDGVGGSQRIVLPDDSTWIFTAIVCGHLTSGSTIDYKCGYKFEGIITRKAGAASVDFVGLPIQTLISNNTANTTVPWNISLTANPTYGSLSINVTGASGQIVRWIASVTTTEVTT